MEQEITIKNIQEFVGKEIGVTDWVELDQMQVNIFGEVTRWNKWMHSDQERSRRESPYGDTLVHGFFLVSLITHFSEIGGLRPKDGSHSLNYGMDKVRILQPVKVGDGVKLRDRISVLKVVNKAGGCKLCTTAHQIEIEGESRPAAYIEYLNYWQPPQQISATSR